MWELKIWIAFTCTIIPVIIVGLQYFVSNDFLKDLLTNRRLSILITTFSIVFFAGIYRTYTKKSVSPKATKANSEAPLIEQPTTLHNDTPTEEIAQHMPIQSTMPVSSKEAKNLIHSQIHESPYVHRGAAISKSAPLQHLQRSPYLLDLRSRPIAKKAVRSSSKKSISDVSPPPAFKPTKKIQPKRIQL